MMTESKNVDWKLVRRFLFFSGYVLLSFFCLSLLFQPVWVPLFVSFFVSYLLAPWVDRLGASGKKRVVVILCFLALFYLAVALLAIWGIPQLYDELFALTRRIPAVYNTLLTKWLPWFRSTLIATGFFNAQEVSSFFLEWREAFQLVEKAQQAMSTLWRTVPNVVGILVHMVLIPFLSFFLLKNYHGLRSRARLYIPRDLQAPLREFGRRVNFTIRSVLRGQVTVAAIVTLGYMVGFTLIGLHSALAIGLIAGVCRLIPYLDVVVGGFLSLIVVLSDFHDMSQLMSLLLVFVVVQTLDGTVITPRVIGERIGLHPIIVILAILSFGQLFGFWGVLLAIPSLAVAKVLWVSATPFYLASSFFRRKI